MSAIRFCLDNDKTGQDATNRIIKELLDNKLYQHIKIEVAPKTITDYIFKQTDNDNEM
jgi:DNA primase